MEVFWAIRAHGIRARSDVEVLDWLVTDGRGKANGVVRQASVRMGERTVECTNGRANGTTYERPSEQPNKRTVELASGRTWLYDLCGIVRYFGETRAVWCRAISVGRRIRGVSPPACPTTPCCRYSPAAIIQGPGERT
jgi:hypothetical protein